GWADRGWGSERESRVRGRPRQENAAQRDALREPGRSPGIFKPLGGALGGHAHSRHDETTSGGHVRRRKTALAATPSGTVPLLPIRGPRGASGWLRGSGGRLLQLAAGMDRAAGPRAMG